MMWSLTPQSLPCQHDTNAASIHHTSAADDDDSHSRQRFVLCLFFYLLISFLVWLGSVVVGRRTSNQKVTCLIPGRSAGAAS